MTTGLKCQASKQIITHADDTDRQWPECGVAWRNGEDNDADQHVHMTDHTNAICDLNSNMHKLFKLYFSTTQGMLP